MSDIDYSQFHYKRKSEESTQRADSRAPALPAKRRKGGKAPLVVIIVILCFALAFFSVDFFTSGFLIESISVSLRGSTYNYYLVVSEMSSRDVSYAQSLLIRQGGGSGYIISEDVYRVVYSVYVDKNQANMVSGKNNGTFVHTLSAKSKDTLLYNTLDNIIRDMISYCQSLEKGDIIESDFLAVVNTSKAKLENLKQKYIEDNKMEVVNLIEFVTETFNSFNFSTETKLVLLSDIRYATANIVVAVTSLEK